MLVEEAIFQLLTQDMDVAALIGTRIYAGLLPETVVYPAVAFRLIQHADVERLEAPGVNGLERSRIRFFSTARRVDETRAYAIAKGLDRAIRKALLGVDQTITDTTKSPQESLRLQGVFQESSHDLYDDETQTHQVISDFDVWSEDPA